jgi:hypothetical protein
MRGHFIALLNILYLSIAQNDLAPSLPAMRQRGISHDGIYPCACRAAARIEACRVPDDLHEGVVEDIVCPLSTRKDSTSRFPQLSSFPCINDGELIVLTTRTSSYSPPIAACAFLTCTCALREAMWDLVHNNPRPIARRQTPRSVLAWVLTVAGVRAPVIATRHLYCPAAPHLDAPAVSFLAAVIAVPCEERLDRRIHALTVPGGHTWAGSNLSVHAAINDGEQKLARRRAFARVDYATEQN